jgi:predicted amidohydrolase
MNRFKPAGKTVTGRRGEAGSAQAMTATRSAGGTADRLISRTDPQGAPLVTPAIIPSRCHFRAERGIAVIPVEGRPAGGVEHVRHEKRRAILSVMATIRIALANLRHPATPEESVLLAEQAVTRAGADRASIVCFPECYVPGYRAPAKAVPAPNAAFLEAAWSTVAAAAARANVAVVLGTERIVDGKPMATALVIDRDGTVAGFQDKVQIDPSEDSVYVPGTDRRVFTTGPLTFGVVICHEGWRYPETVRWAVRRGAQVVFHPHFQEAEPGSHRPTRYAEPANTFHEKAVLCRAAENTCYFATVNYASPGSPTTSAVANPDGTLLGYQPYGEEGLLLADIDLGVATGLVATRFKYAELALPPA